MSETIKITIPMQYTVKEYYIRGRADKIREQVLCRKHKHILGMIEYADGNAALSYKCAICPHCGKRHLLHTVPPRDGYPSRESIENWATGQSSFFAEYGAKHLTLAGDVILPDILACKKCGKISDKGDFEKRIIITSRRGKISISVPIDNMFEFLINATNLVVTLTAPFIYTQEITFNLQNGHTFFSVRDHEGKSVYTRDITTCSDDMFLGSGLPEALCMPEVRKAVRKKFEEYGELSFEDKELNFEKLILATRFVGYPRDFYRKLPFKLGTKKIYPELRSAAKLLRKAKNLPKVYESAGLPKCKSIRRKVFSDPAIMFYLRELKSVCDAVGNIDLISTAFSQGGMYLFLARLTAYPEALRYISDCVKMGNMKKIARIMLGRLYTMERCFDDCIRYAAMSQSGRQYLLGCPTYSKDDEPYILRCVLPSHPIHTPYANLSEGRYAGYDFEWLITTEDYRRAGQIMHNCLADYKEPVMVMKKGGEYVAAFSLESEDSIGQAYLSGNKNIRFDSAALAALEKWALKNKVKFRIPRYDDYDFFNEEPA